MDDDLEKYDDDDSESGECEDDGLASWLVESLSHTLLSLVPLRTSPLMMTLGDVVSLDYFFYSILKSKKALIYSKCIIKKFKKYFNFYIIFIL